MNLNNLKQSCLVKSWGTKSSLLTFDPKEQEWNKHRHFSTDSSTSPELQLPCPHSGVLFDPRFWKMGSTLGGSGYMSKRMSRALMKASDETKEWLADTWNLPLRWWNSLWIAVLRFKQKNGKETLPSGFWDVGVNFQGVDLGLTCHNISQRPPSARTSASEKGLSGNHNRKDSHVTHQRSLPGKKKSLVKGKIFSNTCSFVDVFSFWPPAYVCYKHCWHQLCWSSYIRSSSATSVR